MHKCISERERERERERETYAGITALVKPSRRVWVVSTYNTVSAGAPTNDDCQCQQQHRIIQLKTFFPIK